MKYRIIVWSSNSSLGLYAEGLKAGTWYLFKFVVASLTVTKRWKQPNVNNGKMSKESSVWCLRTVGYYPDLKGREMACATTWMNSEDLTLHEISQTQKRDCCVIPFTWSNS